MEIFWFHLTEIKIFFFTEIGHFKPQQENANTLSFVWFQSIKLAMEMESGCKGFNFANLKKEVFENL